MEWVIGGLPGVIPQDVYYPFLLGGSGIFFSRPALQRLFNYSPEVPDESLDPYREHYDCYDISALRLHLAWETRDFIKTKNLTCACDVSISYYVWKLGMSLLCLPQLFSCNFGNEIRLGCRLMMPQKVAINHFMTRDMMKFYRYHSRTMSDTQIYIMSRYDKTYLTPSNINFHLPILRQYASGCTVIAEYGTQLDHSIWAFLYAFTSYIQPNIKDKDSVYVTPLNIGRLYCVNTVEPYVLQSVKDVAESANVTLKFIKGNSTKVILPEKVELLFIDTFHVYGHLKRELSHNHLNVRKYIIMNNTEIDGEYGEAIRCKLDLRHLVEIYDYPPEEIMLGIYPAIEEFLSEHREWSICYETTDNNGLIIIHRNPDQINNTADTISATCL